MKARAASLAFSALALTAGIVACRGGVSQAIPPNLPTNPTSANARGRGDSTPSKSTIKHVVIVIQENRSFDNFFATFPGADGTTTGKAKTMPSNIADACKSDGMPVITKPTSVPLTKVSLLGKGFPGNFGMDQDLDHIHTGYLLMMNHNKMDGWDVTKFGANGEGTPTCTYSYQYVDPNDIKPYWDMATKYVLADHTFQTQGSGSFTGHQDLIAAGTKISASEALIDNPSYFPWGCDANDSVVTAVIKKGSQKVYPFGGPFPCLEYDTMRDLLDAKGVSWKFYAMPVQKESGCEHGDTAGIWSAFDAIKAVRYSDEWHTNVTRTNKAIFSDIDAGNLPAVSWITPDGVESDHPMERKHPPCQPGKGPLADSGPEWVASIVNAVGQSKYWNSTAVVVVWDDWGGFFDHVVPPLPRTWTGGPGFRVPMLIVSSRVKAHVEHSTYKFGSILRFVEENWGLGSLGQDDAHSNSIGNAFDLNMSPRRFHTIGSKLPKSYFLKQPPSYVAPDSE